MSVHVMSWVLRNSRATLGSRLVLLVLADYCDDRGGNCWPSVQTIANETLLSKRQVQYALRSLEAMGEISVERPGGGRKSTRYRVVAGAQNLHPSGNGRGAVDCTPEAQPIAPDPSVEPPEKKTLHPPRRTKAELNAVWDSLTDIFGAPTTRSAETLRGRVVQSLSAAGATREEIFRRAKSWPAHFDSATLTPSALEKHWDALGKPPLRRK